jgi:hypothetical protein
MLASRHFQANCKLLTVSCAALVGTLLLMAYVPPVRAVVPIFGYAAVCLSFQDRLEATVEKVSAAAGGWRGCGDAAQCCACCARVVPC